MKATSTETIAGGSYGACDYFNLLSKNGELLRSRMEDYIFSNCSRAKVAPMDPEAILICHLKTVGSYGAEGKIIFLSNCSKAKLAPMGPENNYNYHVKNGKLLWNRRED